MLSRSAERMLAVGLTILLSGCSLGPMMILEHRSPYDFDKTVATVVNNATARGWEAPKSFDFRASLVAHGQPDPGRITVIKLCSPQFASRMFADDDSKYVSVMAPCSISVYEKSDGRTYLAAMNMGLMARLIGGEVGRIMTDIAADDAAITAFTNAESPPSTRR